MNVIRFIPFLIIVLSWTNFEAFAYEKNSSKHISKSELRRAHKACNGDFKLGYCATLGKWYEEGKRVKQDFAEAERLYQLDCERKITTGIGCLRLGNLYNNPNFSGRDEQKARVYFKMACDIENNEGCTKLIELGVGSAEITNFLADNSKKAGVKTTQSGLQYEVLRQGSSKVSPTEIGDIAIHVKGSLLDGSEFISTFAGEPVHFPRVNLLPVRLLSEGVMLMKPGDRFRFYIPPSKRINHDFEDNLNLQNVPAYEMLIVEIELIDAIPEGWKYEETEFGATASITSANWEFENGAFYAHDHIESLSIIYDRNTGELGEWKYSLSVAYSSGIYGTDMSLENINIAHRSSQMVKIKDEDNVVRSMYRQKCELGDNCLGSSFVRNISPELIETIRLASAESGTELVFGLNHPDASRYKRGSKIFSLNGFSDAVMKLRLVAEEFADDVRRNGPILKYERQLEAFELPTESLDCPLDAEKIRLTATVFKLSEVDQYLQKVIDNQEKCFSHQINSNFESIEKLVVGINGSWNWKTTEKTINTKIDYQTNLFEWHVPIKCFQCKISITENLSRAEKLAVSVSEKRAQTTQMMNKLRPIIVAEIQQKNAYDIARRNENRRLEEKKQQEDRAFYKSINEANKNQPSELDTFSQAIGNTARNIERQRQLKQQQKMNDLAKQAELQAKVNRLNEASASRSGDGRSNALPTLTSTKASDPEVQKTENCVLPHGYADYTKPQNSEGVPWCNYDKMKKRMEDSKERDRRMGSNPLGCPMPVAKDACALKGYGKEHCRVSTKEKGSSCVTLK